MKVMVIGGGGREHAIIKALRKNDEVETIYALPGNGGIAADATCVAIGAKDLDGIVAFAREQAIDYAVVTPDDPLVLGAVDRLEAIGVPCFGPRAAAALIEGSKVFAKALMKKYNIPTAAYETFTNVDTAIQYLKQRNRYPAVIKADGLALGKGVLIAEDEAAAIDAIRVIMVEKKFGKSGERIIIEEFLTGPEVTVLAFTDGKTVVPMVSSMDHKRALDGDQGLNTGGMGTVAPNPFYTEDVAAQVWREIMQPTVTAMQREGRPFKGCLYFGLMLTPDGPKVIEYNCRFGDPEAQVVLPLLESDLLTVMRATTDGTLAETAVRFASDCACCVVMAAGGYPESYQKGVVIDFNDVDRLSDTVVYHAGTALAEGALVTAGGRVLGVTATASTMAEAIDKAYNGVRAIHFKGAHYRRDIGARCIDGI